MGAYIQIKCACKVLLLFSFTVVISAPMIRFYYKAIKQNKSPKNCAAAVVYWVLPKRSGLESKDTWCTTPYL